MVAKHLLEIMKDKGCKITPQRRLIIEILENGSHKSADEIFNEVKKKQPNVSFGTVYRNLNILNDLGLVRELDFKDGCNRYELAGKHHHHLVCLGCGKAIELEMCPLQHKVEEAVNEHNFEIATHSFKIYGYCSRCR
ncbi:MAG: Fur family transcriptional regulator, ferric uptake regulator [Clostridia bacterium]|jgi:Fe2+ or Zn2+ uptake regulation protein|nr:ferric uptake regulator, Fur family [Clostridiales bacterium]MDK2985043.1 Fur family transcriptional regulator, ferric uptake regulator [Clostridia bacterium]